MSCRELCRSAALRGNRRGNTLRRVPDFRDEWVVACFGVPRLGGVLLVFCTERSCAHADRTPPRTPGEGTGRLDVWAGERILARPPDPSEASSASPARAILAHVKDGHVGMSLVRGRT